MSMEVVGQATDPGIPGIPTPWAYFRHGLRMDMPKANRLKHSREKTREKGRGACVQSMLSICPICTIGVPVFLWLATQKSVISQENGRIQQDWR